MHDLAERRHRIARQLEELLVIDLGISTADVPAEEWDELEPSRAEGFGFLWPRRIEGSIFVAFSSGVIADQTAWLDDPQLDEYLRLLEFLLSSYVADLEGAPDRPGQDRRNLVEEQLWSLRPEAMHWLSVVQLRILDAILGEPA